MFLVFYFRFLFGVLCVFVLLLYCYWIVSPFVLSLSYFRTSLPTIAAGWKTNCSQ